MKKVGIIGYGRFGKVLADLLSKRYKVLVTDRNPDQYKEVDISSIEEILHEIDMVLLMSVNPGFGGQEFIPSMLDKIQNLNDVMSHYENPIELEVDGGIKTENAGEIKAAGASVLVAGSAIFNSNDYKKAIESLREA